METTSSTVCAPRTPCHDESKPFVGDLMDSMEKLSSSMEHELVSMLKDAIRGLQISGISSVFFDDAECSCVWSDHDHKETVASIAVPLLVWKLCQVFDAKEDANKDLAFGKWTAALKSIDASVMFMDIFKQWLMNKDELKPYFAYTKLWDPLIVKAMEMFKQKVIDENILSTFAISDFREEAFLKEVEQVCNLPETVGPNLVVYGTSVKLWLSNPEGPKAYGLAVDSGSLKTEFVPKAGIGGCFLPGTQIVVEGGETVAIENLNNKTIVGNARSLGFVSTKVSLVTKTNRKIYGFNEEEPFFTADHPFMTQEGWKAIDPQTAKSGNPSLSIGQLQVGDSVKKLTNYDNRTHSMTYMWEKIINLSSGSLPKESTVYGIKIREGLSSCHANKYVAYVDYPGYAGAKATDENSYEDIYEKPLKTPPKHSIQLDAVYLEDMNITYPLYADEHSKIPKDHWQLLESLPSNIRVDTTTIFIDDVIVETSSQITENQLAWTRELPHGGIEEGVIHFHPHRLSGYGKLILSPGGLDLTQPYVISFNAHLSAHSYICELLTCDTLKYEGEGGIRSFHFGHDESPTHHTLTGKVDGMHPAFELFDIGQNMLFSVSKYNKAKFEVSIPVEYRSWIGFSRLSGVFFQDYTGFTGEAVQYNPNMLGGEGRTFTWNGKLTTGKQPINRDLQSHFKHISKREITSKQIKSSPEFMSFSSPTKAAYSSMASSNLTNLQKAPASPLSNQSVAMTLTPNIEFISGSLNEALSLTDLISITPPSQVEAHNLTFSYIKQSMLYVIKDDWRTNILGATKPDLLHGLDKVAEKYKTVLTDKYGVGYITSGLIDSPLEKEKFSDVERNQVLFFWAGAEDGCLSKNKDFSNMYFRTSLIAFQELTPKLKLYINSPDPKGWAKKLYDYLTQPLQLNRFSSATNIEDTTLIVQKHCMVLQCLAPTEKYGTDFYTKLILRNVQQRTNFFIGSNTMDMLAFLDESNKNLIERVLAKDPKFSKEYVEDMDKVIQGAAKELKINTTDKSPKDVAWLLSKQIHGLMSQFLSIWKEKGGTLWWRHSEAITSFFMRNPKLFLSAKLISNAFAIGSWGMAFYGTIRTLMGWKDLSTEMKVAAIFNTVNFAVSSISGWKGIVEELSEVGKGFYNIHFARRAIAGADDPQVIELFATEARDMVGIVNEGVQMEEIIASESASITSSEEEMNLATQRVQEEFSVLERTAQVTTVLALIAGSVALGFRIYNDLKDGQPVLVTVMDIMQEVVMGLQIVVGVLRLASDFVEIASLPIFGSVLAIAGIIMFLVSSFSQEDKKPETEADKFVNEYSKPFIKPLKKPSQKWIDDYNTHHKKP